VFFGAEIGPGNMKPLDKTGAELNLISINICGNPVVITLLFLHSSVNFTG
jgi:hypothetical protein